MICIVQLIYNNTSGFIIKFAASDQKLVLIPSGYCLVTASHGAVYIRQGVSADDQDSFRVKGMLEEVLHSFPEFRASPYNHQQFQVHLESLVAGHGF